MAGVASLEGKTALVCGVSNERSISWGIARAMHEAGARIALSYGPAMEKRVRPLAERIGCDFVEPCDATSDGEIAALFARLAERYGTIDAVAHGIVGARREDLGRPFIETSREGFLLAQELSVYSLVALTRAALPLMPEGGSVVTLSYHGAQKMMPSYNVMGVAKAALESAVRYLASDAGPQGVRVNAISAGPVRTLSAAGVGGFRDLFKVFPRVTPPSPPHLYRGRGRRRRLPRQRRRRQHQRPGPLRRRRLQHPRHGHARRRGRVGGRGVKAVVIEQTADGGALVYRDVPDPIAGPDDLLVAVRACALNRADVLQRMGGYPQPGPKPEFEIPGLEYAGEVLEAGARVEGFARGDRVMGLLPGGGYAELVSVPQRLAVAVPDSLGWREAGCVPEVFITAHDALRQCDLQAGERTLIHAVGSGVGVAAVQIAKVMGAAQVIGTAGSAEKLGRAAELGLDVGVNYREADFAEAVLEATDGAGVDVILDVIGAPYWERNLRALARQGRMVEVGLMGGAVAERANLGPLLMKRLQVRGTTLRARPLEQKAAATRAFEKSVLPHIASGRVKVVVDSVYPLREAAAAQARMEANANFGKIALEPWRAPAAGAPRRD